MRKRPDGSPPLLPLAWRVPDMGLRGWIVDPVLSGNPVDDIAPRAAVTLRPLVTYLIIFDLTFGFLTGMVLLLICGLLGAPAAVLVAALLAGAVVAVTYRRVLIRYRRDPGSPLPPMPTAFGEYRIWARTHFLPVSLPLFFRVPADELPVGAAEPRQPRTWIGRRADRQREIIREEFAARGHPLPE